MLILTSPAKTLDLDSDIPRGLNYTKPRFLDQTTELHQILKSQSRKQLQQTLGVSDDLTELNYQRFQDWQSKHNLDNSRPALFTYAGDIYQQLKPHQYTEAELKYSQQTLRIISAFYCLVRPLDLIQPYRLEMITKLDQVNKLDHYWKTKLTQTLNKEIDKFHHPAVINLASNAYSKAIDFKSLNRPVINIHFKEKKKDKYQTVAIYAKQARGAIIDYAIVNQITQPEKLKNFTRLGYRFNTKLTNKNNWTFTR